MVRFTYKYLKPVALFLAIAVLFQCCKIYDKYPVSLEASTNNNKVKIVFDDGSVQIFDSIYYKPDGYLYGIAKKMVDRTKEIIIPKDQINEITLDIGPNGTKEVIITNDSMKYFVDSYYYENDILYGKLSKAEKNNTIEVLIPKENIKEIYLFNYKKSRTGTAFLIIGSIPAGFALAGLIAFIYTWIMIY